jgi:hypothetical protein
MWVEVVCGGVCVTSYGSTREQLVAHHNEALANEGGATPQSEIWDADLNDANRMD